MNSNWSYSPETPNLGQIRRFLEPCDLEIWRMTLKNNRAPLLCCFQLCAWFHCHMWIQTGVRVRKRLSWVLTSVTLTFDLWPWPFAWTSLLTMVITPENFMMKRWWEHGEKSVTDRQTDGRTDGRTDGQTDGLNQSYSCLVAAKNWNTKNIRLIHELMLTGFKCYKWTTCNDIWIKIPIFCLRKWISKCWMQNVGHYVLASMY